MAAKSLTTWQKAAALVPLAALSGAWTISLAVSGANANDEAVAHRLPDGTTVPTEAIEKPANVSAPGEIAPGVKIGDADKVIENSSANGIPAAALAAYQRAAQVIDSADPACKIQWPLIAAIGRVESNHGRYGGNVLSDQGVSTPGIYGIPLNGSNGTAQISDTDAGQYDNDTTYDRAVGPMQFIPSTWSVVGVDGDGDGQRNPQDIDDAALATAVYLCSGDEDLSARPGQESAVFRYNHSKEYVALVLGIMDAYADGDFSAVPNGTTEAPTFTPMFGDSVISSGTSGYKPPKSNHSSSASSSTSSNTDAESDQGLPALGGKGTADDPTKALVDAAPKVLKDPVGAVGDTVKNAGGTVEQTLTPLQEATKYCSDSLTKAQLNALGGVSGCVQAYLKGGAGAVTNLLKGLLGTVGGLLGPSPK